MDRTIISIFVENNPGVLVRVVSLFGQRSYNIESLTVSITNKEDISRITICTKPSQNTATIDQITKQIKKLVEIKEVWQIETSNALARDLALIKFDLHKHTLEDIKNTLSEFEAKIIYSSAEHAVVEIVGEPESINKYLEATNKYNITAMCRTGITAMEKVNTVNH